VVSNTPPKVLYGKYTLHPGVKGKIPDQTGGAGLYKLIGTSQVLPLCCEVETEIPEMLKIETFGGYLV